MSIKCILTTDDCNYCLNPECKGSSLIEYIHKTASGCVLLEQCPRCGRVYITRYHLKAYPGEFLIMEDKTKRTEPLEQATSVYEKESEFGHISAYVYAGNRPNRCLSPNCHCDRFIKQKTLVKSRKDRDIEYGLWKCEQCGAFVCPYSVYTRNTGIINCLNPDVLQLMTRAYYSLAQVLQCT